MSSPSDRLINLLGAVALGLADRIRLAAREETALGGETVAALVVLGHSPGLSVQQLQQVLGLSQPGTVRLVDRLTAAGFALRGGSGKDRRTLALHLTDKGRAQRTAVLERRRETLQPVLQSVAMEDRAVLERLAEAMLRTMPDDAVSALAVCRFCDQDRCPDCPMDTFAAIGDDRLQ